MCLIGIAYRAHPRYPLLVAANRDEFHQRSADAARFWPDAPHLLAGRDRRGGGTWLGLSTSGRFAVVTNYREPSTTTTGERSRGELVTRFISSRTSAAAFARQVTQDGARYGGFSLLVMDRKSLWFASNREASPQRVPAGVHGLSNQALNSPWPKVKWIREALAGESTRARPGEAALLRCLRDRTPAQDRALPDTGVGRVRERLLSPPFIVNKEYGTRCSTLVRLDADGRAAFREDSYDPSGGLACSRRFGFRTRPTGC